MFGERGRSAWALTALVVGVGAVAYRALAQPAIPRAEADPYLGIPEGGGPVDVGAPPAGLDQIDAASCGECHERHYEEWRSSVHHTAYTNPVFVAEYGRRQREFCARCHAPRPAVASDGIDCAVCHVRDGAVLNPTVSGRAPHRSVRAPELARPEACARCHEFDFENQPGERLQRTLTEWSHSRAATEGQTCQGCHMGGEPGHHRHDAPGSRDTTMRQRALRAEASARRRGEGVELTLSLRVAGAGHAVPTGDMFRRLEVSAWTPDRPGEVSTAWLRRRFRVDREGWHETRDTRVPERGERAVVLEVGPAERVAWAVHLWLLPRSEAEEAGIPLDEVRYLMAAGNALVQ